MKSIFDNISHYGDILAIPFFFLLVLHFYKIEKRKPIENLLLFFSVSGLVLDILFTWQYFNKH
jgi:hypothetical protein